MTKPRSSGEPSVRAWPAASLSAYSMHLDSADSGPWPESALWFVIEGIDGSGKTSTALEVSRRMTDVPLVNCSHKEVAAATPVAEGKLRELAALLWPPGDHSFVRSLPSRYRVHMHAAWYSLFSECVLKRRLLNGEVLLLDSWVYKFLAHLIVFGYDADFLDLIFSHVPRPTAVVLVDPTPAHVWRRKRQFSPIELGLYMGYEALGRDSFIDYQEQIRAELHLMADRYHWQRVTVVEGEPLESVAARAEHCLRQTLSADVGGQIGSAAASGAGR